MSIKTGAQLSDIVRGSHPAGQDKHVVFDRRGGTFIWVFANGDSFG